MKKSIMIIIVLLSIVGCKVKGSSDYNKISSIEAKEIIDSEEVIILDVRTQQEYNEGHIKDALLIPDYDLEALVESQIEDKDAKILIYCRSGNRSKSAALKLIEMGYKDVYDFGGINTWPYEVVLP